MWKRFTCDERCSSWVRCSEAECRAVRCSWREDGPGNLVVYQMTEPYDFQELLRAEMPQATRQQYQVQAGYIPEKEFIGAVCFR